MGYHIVKSIPSSNRITNKYPLSTTELQRVMQHREEIKNILSGEDSRLLLIVGPCSAWPKHAVLEYAEKLLGLSKQVSNHIKLLMRVYVQKPRTRIGWLGPAIQPDPFSEADIEQGIQYVRDMMVKVSKLGLPIASEILFPNACSSFVELLSWACVGARSSENQEHRIFASSLDCPVGIKNPTHGSLETCANSVTAAQHSHAAILDKYQIQTHGNPFSHAVLRGANNAQNYSIEHLEEINFNLNQQNVKNPALLIDASHDNCVLNGKKNYRLQPYVVHDVLTSLERRPHLKSLVKGFMLESFLVEGNQTIKEKTPDNLQLNGLSITDPCLSWSQTETLILGLADRLQPVKSTQISSYSEAIERASYFK